MTSPIVHGNQSSPIEPGRMEDTKEKITGKRRASSPMGRESKRTKTIVSVLQDPVPILDNMLEVVNRKYTENYGNLMAAGTKTVKETILMNLSPVLMGLFAQKSPVDVYNLLSIRGDFPRFKPGIYMHIVRKNLDARQFYLYIGQAKDLQKRISEHRNPGNRRAHPSLHYHVLDSGTGSDKMIGTFVLLGSCDVPDTYLQQYLNLMELFACIWFQTLPERTLRKFLPPDAAISTNLGLNVGSPISQGFETCGWSLMLLRNSEDPLVQAYYASRVGLGAATRRKDQLALTRDGGLRTLHAAKFGGPWFSIGCLDQKFFIPLGLCAELQLVKGEPVYVEFEVNDTDSQHPHKFASDASDDDPGKRVAVKVSGAKADGEPYMFYLSNDGEKAAKRANSLFDFIAGVNDTADSINVPRRYLAKNKTLGRPKNVYT